MFRRAILQHCALSKDRLLAALVDIVRPSGTGSMLLPAVSRKLDDDVMEAISDDYGGILSFVGKHGTSVGLETMKRNTPDGRAAWHITMATVKEQSSFIPPAPSKPAPAPPSQRVSASMMGRERVSLTSVIPIPKVVMAKDPALALFPAYLVPVDGLLTCAEALGFVASEESGSFVACVVAALVAARNKLDVVSPTLSPEKVIELLDSCAAGNKEQLETLQSLLAPAAAGSAAVGSQLFVRVSPPFVTAGSEKANAVLAPMKVEDYDAFRLARHLTSLESRTLKSLEEVEASHLSKPLRHVILASPELFQFSEEHQAVKFILPPQFRVPDLPYPEEDLIDKISEEREEIRALKKKKQLTTKHIRSASVLTRLHKRWKHRDSVFQHPEVLAYHVFDVLPASNHIFIDDLHLLMEEDARYGTTIDIKYLSSRPHLFHTFRVNNDWRRAFQRADLPRPDLRPLMREDILPNVLEVAQHVWASTSQKKAMGECDAGTIRAKLLKPARQLLEQLYGSVDNFLLKHPEHFHIVPGKKSNGSDAGASLVVADAQAPLTPEVPEPPTP